MAIITPSQLVTELRGSVGGDTFSRNHYRAYVKERKAPTDTPSSYKTTARNAMQTASQMWATLTDAERLGWNVAAKQFECKSRLGKQTPLTGFNFFSRMNFMLTLAERDPVTVPGNPVKLPRFGLYTPQVSPSGAGITYSLAPSPSTVIAFIYASPPVSPGRMSVNSTQLLFISAQNVFSGTNVFDCSTEWFSRFGDPSDFPGMASFWGITFFDSVGGSISQRTVRRCLIDS